MKVIVLHWTGRYDDIPNKYLDDKNEPKETEITPKDVIELFNLGYEVMMHHHRDGRIFIVPLQMQKNTST